MAKLIDRIITAIVGEGADDEDEARDIISGL